MPKPQRTTSLAPQNSQPRRTSVENSSSLENNNNDNNNSSPSSSRQQQQDSTLFAHQEDPFAGFALLMDEKVTFIEKFCGNWYDFHAKRFKRLHLILCLLLICAGIAFAPFEYSRALLVLNEVEGVTGIALAAPELENALDPAGIALLLLDEVSQNLNLTVNDFVNGYQRFGLGGGGGGGGIRDQNVSSPLVFASSSENPPLMPLASIGLRTLRDFELWQAQQQQQQILKFLLPPLIRSSSLTYQLVTEKKNQDLFSTTTTTTATTTTTTTTPFMNFTTTAISSNNQTSQFSSFTTIVDSTTTASIIIPTTTTSSIESNAGAGGRSPNVEVLFGGTVFGEFGCSLPPDSSSTFISSSSSPTCFHTTDKNEKITYDARISQVLEKTVNDMKYNNNLSSSDIFWMSESIFPSWTLANGQFLIWGELEEEEEQVLSSTAISSTIDPNNNNSTTTTTTTTTMSTTTTTTVTPVSRNSTASPTPIPTKNPLFYSSQPSKLRLKLFSPLWVGASTGTTSASNASNTDSSTTATTTDRQPLLYASVTIDVRRLQITFLNEFYNQKRAQQGVIGIWLDRRGPTTAGTVVAWSGGLIDSVYNATDTPWPKLNNVVMQLLILNGGLLPQHSITLSAADSSAYVCRVVQPHWLTVTLIPKSTFEASPLYTGNNAAQNQVHSQTLAYLPLVFMFCLTMIVTMFHGLIMSFKRPPGKRITLNNNNNNNNNNKTNNSNNNTSNNKEKNNNNNSKSKNSGSKKKGKNNNKTSGQNDDDDDDDENAIEMLSPKNRSNTLVTNAFNRSGSGSNNTSNVMGSRQTSSGIML